MRDPLSIPITEFPDAVLAVGRDSSIVSANAQAERLFGYGRGELADLALEMLVPEEYRDTHGQLIERFFAKPETRPMGIGRELHGLKRDGQEFPMEISIGSTAGDSLVVAVIRDLTTTVQLRDELQESELRFRIGTSLATDVIYYVNVQKDLLEWYGDIDRLMGYEAGEFPRTISGWFELLHPDDKNRVNAYIDRTVEAGAEYWDLRYRVRAADGSYRHWWATGTVTEFIDGRTNAGYSAIVDETERVLARQQREEALREVTQQFHLNRSILTSLNGSLAVLDRDGTIVAVNDLWTEFGDRNGATSQAKTGVGMNYLDVCALPGTPDSDNVRAGIESVLDGTKAKFETDYPCHSPSEERWFSMTATPLRTQAGGAVVVHVDISDRIEARKRLERALAEIEQLKDRLQGESRHLQREIKSDHDFEQIIGNSSPMKATLLKVEKVAPTDTTVLVLGETGTGKELIARAIHSRSDRSERPLIKIDCGALPPGLVESELFGHEKGAFTGATDKKRGRFELAHGGTVFLDEIGELSLDLQTKLLRVLEEGVIKPVGSEKEKNVDVRIIAATNRDLKGEVAKGRFRSDLYYRLSVFLVESPPLRDRREDIPLLTAFFISNFSAGLGKNLRAVKQTGLDKLMSYDWPGNIRELKNVLERAAILSEGETLDVEEVLGVIDGPDRSLKGDLETVERSRILRALEDSAWKIKGEHNAASRLGLKPSTLRARMKRLEITRPERPNAVSSAPGPGAARG